MRFNLNKDKSKTPENGTLRIKRKFLFFPKIINGEFRWLEKAMWSELYQYKWYTIKWIDWRE